MKDKRAARAAEPAKQAKKSRKSLSSGDKGGRKEAILAAALSVFVKQGFANARMDDVAAAANVAKGTLYLYFKDKDDLFQKMVKDLTEPVLDRLTQFSAAPNLPPDQILRAMFQAFIVEVAGTQRRELVWLVLTEGPRFPKLAAYYHQEVISRVLKIVGRVLAQNPSALRNPQIASYPQLAVAPMIFGMIWTKLFDAHEKLDLDAMLKVHLNALFRETPQK